MSLRKPFLDHLEDLRWTLVKIVLVLLLTTGSMFYFAPQLIKILMMPLQGVSGEEIISLRTLRPTSGFLISLKVAFLFGALLSFPMIFYFIAHFFLPALKGKERRWLGPVFLAGGGLFAIGISFCFFVVLPITLSFLWGYTERMNLANDWTIEYYTSFVMGLILIFGVVFELPIVVLGLVKASILTPEFLRQKRMYAVLGIVIMAAILTPPDVVSQILLAVPMMALYEVCIWTARFFK